MDACLVNNPSGSIYSNVVTTLAGKLFSLHNGCNIYLHNGCNIYQHNRKVQFCIFAQ